MFLIMCIRMYGGLSKNASIGGKQYFVSFVDDYSRQNLLYTMSHKNEVLDIFVEWRKKVICFCSNVVMKALGDTSQLDKFSNRMGGRKI